MYQERSSKVVWPDSRIRNPAKRMMTTRRKRARPRTRRARPRKKRLRTNKKATNHSDVINQHDFLFLLEMLLERKTNQSSYHLKVAP